MKMRYQIVCRHMSPHDGRCLQHIAAVKWRVNSSIGQCTLQQMVAAIESGDTTFVRGAAFQSEVGVFESNGVKYLRTYADGYWDDNLLALTTF
jgi:hypothetical protein